MCPLLPARPPLPSAGGAGHRARLQVLRKRVGVPGCGRQRRDCNVPATSGGCPHRPHRPAHRGRAVGQAGGRGLGGGLDRATAHRGGRHLGAGEAGQGAGGSAQGCKGSPREVCLRRTRRAECTCGKGGGVCATTSTPTPAPSLLRPSPRCVDGGTNSCGGRHLGAGEAGGGRVGRRKVARAAHAGVPGRLRTSGKGGVYVVPHRHPPPPPPLPCGVPQVR